ncbi:MAG: hypothetical protein IT386_02750 [Deltaproteobacteria bacterium]|nr:hypothetical protein [Deltaproteobacteria bacterium]
MQKRWCLVAALCLGIGLGGASASATQVTLSTDVPAMAIPLGAEFTLTVDLDDVDEIRAYTLDVAWSGVATLDLVGAAQLACGQSIPGTCTALPFTVDPLGAPPAPATARAGLLILPPTSLFLDGRTNDPAVDPRQGLFSLTFRALTLGTGTFDAGILDLRVDGVIGIDDFVALDPAVTTVSFEVVPEPGTAQLVLFTAAAAALARRRGRAA